MHASALANEAASGPRGAGFHSGSAPLMAMAGGALAPGPRHSSMPSGAWRPFAAMAPSMASSSAGSRTSMGLDLMEGALGGGVGVHLQPHARPQPHAYGHGQPLIANLSQEAAHWRSHPPYMMSTAHPAHALAPFMSPAAAVGMSLPTPQPTTFGHPASMRVPTMMPIAAASSEELMVGRMSMGMLPGLPQMQISVTPFMAAGASMPWQRVAPQQFPPQQQHQQDPHVMPHIAQSHPLHGAGFGSGSIATFPLTVPVGGLLRGIGSASGSLSHLSPLGSSSEELAMWPVAGGAARLYSAAHQPPAPSAGAWNTHMGGTGGLGKQRIIHRPMAPVPGHAKLHSKLAGVTLASSASGGHSSSSSSSSLVQMLAESSGARYPGPTQQQQYRPRAPLPGDVGAGAAYQTIALLQMPVSPRQPEPQMLSSSGGNAGGAREGRTRGQTGAGGRLGKRERSNGPNAAGDAWGESAAAAPTFAHKAARTTQGGRGASGTAASSSSFNIYAANGGSGAMEDDDSDGAAAKRGSYSIDAGFDGEAGANGSAEDSEPRHEGPPRKVYVGVSYIPRLRKWRSYFFDPQQVSRTGVIRMWEETGSP